MAENGNGKKYPTWQWLTAILITLVLAMGAWAWNDTRTCIKDNQTSIRQKVDKEQYYKDIDSINKNLGIIQGDVKNLLQRK